MPDGREPPSPAMDETDQEDETVDILYLVDRLEELVGVGKRVPFSGRVMVEEEEFLGLVDQLREAVPNEIRQAQRIIKGRERIIGESQEEAAKILETARQRAEYIVSQQGVLNEARQRGEELLRQIEEQHKRSLGEVDDYGREQFGLVEEAIRQSLGTVDEALRAALAKLGQAKEHIGR